MSMPQSLAPYAKRPPLTATILALSGVAVLCTLGGWQLERRAQKHELLARMDTADKMPPRKFSPSDLIPENEFMRGEIAGELLYGKEIAISSRTHNGQIGVHIVTPLRLDDGTAILVNRGWAPKDYAPGERSDNAEHVTGYLRSIEKPNMFVPANIPAKNEWYAINAPEISNALHIPNIRPIMLYEMETQNTRTSQKQYPLALNTAPRPNDNHLQYALFWFSMAVILTTIFWLRFMKSPRKNP